MNAPTPAGALRRLGLIILLVGGLAAPARAWTLTTDLSWKAMKYEGDDWIIVDFDDAAWPDAVMPPGARNQTLASTGWVMKAGAIDIWDKDSREWTCLRKMFYIEEPPAAASLRICADDDYILYINGKEIGRDKEKCRVNYDGDTYDISSALAAGQNVIAIKGLDCGGQRGVVCVVQLGEEEMTPAESITQAEAKAARAKRRLLIVIGIESVLLVIGAWLCIQLRRAARRQS